jgi:hypothetical protein
MHSVFLVKSGVTLEEESKMLISFPTNVDQHFRENVGGNLLKKCWIQHFLYINVSVFLS